MEPRVPPPEPMRRCSAGDRAGWDDLWRSVGPAARGPIVRLLRIHRLDPGLADDIEQDFYIFLREHDLAPRADGLGVGVPVSVASIRTVAGHFAANWVRHWRRARAREDGAARAAARPERAGLGEPEVALVYAELEAGLPGRLRRNLRALVQPPGPLPARTGRRWTAELWDVIVRRLR